MKLKSKKATWSTVLCAAAVFSLTTLHDAQADTLPSPAISPAPIIGTTDQHIRLRAIQPLPPIAINPASGDKLNGDFRGRIIVD